VLRSPYAQHENAFLFITPTRKRKHRPRALAYAVVRTNVVPGGPHASSNRIGSVVVADGFGCLRLHGLERIDFAGSRRRASIARARSKLDASFARGGHCEYQSSRRCVRRSVLSVELAEVAVAQGSTPLENPASVVLADGSTVVIDHYGTMGPGPMVPLTGNVEAQRTEPDKNTYLVLRDQTGPDPTYDYGTHFVFQGHEVGLQGGALTRINLDADGPHRVTLWAATLADGSPIAGTTDRRGILCAPLVFTTENRAPERTEHLTFPRSWRTFRDPRRGVYEGVQNDAMQRVDRRGVGGKAGVVKHARQAADSFVYRFVPKKVGSRERGRLEALQVTSLETGMPIAFHDGQATPTSSRLTPRTFVLRQGLQDQVGHHPMTPRSTARLRSAPTWRPRLCKQRLQRPENGQFRPGVRDVEFFFDETGDTTLTTEAGSAFGGFGAIFKLSLRHASSTKASFRSSSWVTRSHGLDNCAFWNKDFVAFVEDAGDGLHASATRSIRPSCSDVRRITRIQRTFRCGSSPKDGTLPRRSTRRFPGSAWVQQRGRNGSGYHVSTAMRVERGILGALTPRLFHGDGASSTPPSTETRDMGDHSTSGQRRTRPTIEGTPFSAEPLLRGWLGRGW